ncbi:MAG: chromosomal replication initiator protein DnaA [Eubacterium sp.]|nr:chromosomal replication initiator protein DnaA [Eubacterium sp.]
MEQIKQKWQDILSFAKTEFELTDSSFNNWLKPLEPYSVEDRLIKILVPKDNQTVLDYIIKKYTEPLQVSIKEMTGTLYDLEFIVEEDKEKSSYINNKVTSSYQSENLSLNPNYTFDTFVVGSNNTMAHSASLAVAESPGEAYNPLFLWGGVGLGKTHLMQSIAHYIKTANPSAVVRYVSSEKFTIELIEAIKNNKNQEFRDKYRNVDALLIDDIQFIIGKDSTQEEFFHTFNELHIAKKQIVITSDKPPKDLQRLEERIRTRLEWGLMVNINAPDYETRMAILRRKEETDGFKLDDDILNYIATNVTANIRELEGSLNKLLAFSKLTNTPITMEVAKKELESLISPQENRNITPDFIIDTVCEHFHLTRAELLSKKRTNAIARPRMIAMYLCRHMTDSSLENIGSVMGKDHSTIHHGIEKIEKELSTDQQLKTDIEVLQKILSP